MSEKRGPGRPKQEAKTGKSSWKPASVTEVTNKDPDKRYRWVNKLQDNVAKKMQEGWTYATSGLADEERIEHGKSLTTTLEKHDVVLMTLPEESDTGQDAKSRDRWLDEKNERRIAGLTSHLKKDLGKEGASTHGEITISSRKGEQTY